VISTLFGPTLRMRYDLRTLLIVLAYARPLLPQRGLPRHI
jgi:hypothetical protein